MSQVFSADSVNITSNVSIPASGESPVLTGNFLSPPFQNAKGVVSGSIYLTTGSGTTGLRVSLRRNPNAENVLLVGSNNITVAASAGYQFSVQVADPIPDGRPVQYQLTVTQLTGTGVGTAFSANVTVFLISG